MPRLNVGRIVNDPDFNQVFLINRTTGNWVDGVFVTSVNQLRYSGVILPNTSQEMVQTPYGDSIKGFINIYTECVLYPTHLSSSALTDVNRLSDEIQWHEQAWKILTVNNFNDFGYYHAVAVRKRGA